MMRSMYAGVSGVRAHQLMMDVISNNIANVNTTAFKSSRVQFADALSEFLGKTKAPGSQNIRPIQVGLGVRVRSTPTEFNGGAKQLTERPLDLSINGDGFLMANVSGERLYTRAGSLSFDQSQRLVDGNGNILYGWVAGEAGNVDTNVPLTEVALGPVTVISPSPTAHLSVSGSLPVETEIGSAPTRSVVEVVDVLGSTHRVPLEFQKSGLTTWQMTVFDTEDQPISTVELSFDPATGQLTSPTTPPEVTLSLTNGTTPITFTIDFKDAESGKRLVHYGTKRPEITVAQDGKTAGKLVNYSITDRGLLVGVYSNGVVRNLAQLAVASFSNNDGLAKTGSQYYRETPLSGQPTVGLPGEDDRGDFAPGTLEMSNVDLAREFTDLILAQRGFQASSRVITTSDEMIQELVNLKR